MSNLTGTQVQHEVNISKHIVETLQFQIQCADIHSHSYNPLLLPFDNKRFCFILKHLKKNVFRDILNTRISQKQSWSLTLSCGFQQTVKHSNKSNSQKHVNRTEWVDKTDARRKCGAVWLTEPTQSDTQSTSKPLCMSFLTAVQVKHGNTCCAFSPRFKWESVRNQ